MSMLGIGKGLRRWRLLAGAPATKLGHLSVRITLHSYHSSPLGLPLRRSRGLTDFDARESKLDKPADGRLCKNENKDIHQIETETEPR